MTNRPWMPLYVADYRADTAHLNAAEHGAYLLLIMHYWQTGALPADDAPLARIACMRSAEWRKARPTLQSFFHDGWRHKRIDAELARAADISSKRRASAEQRHNKSNANAEHLDTHAGASSPSQSHPHEEISSLRSENARAPERAGFDEFWAAYPHKVGRKAAYKAFVIAVKSQNVTLERLMFGLTAYVNKTDDRPWCNPATWLNQGRWDDKPAQENPKNGRSVVAAADRLIEQLGGMEAAREYVPGSAGPAPLSLDFGPSAPGVRLISKR